jgi:MYXO-CTERM domain-containing protein
MRCALAALALMLVLAWSGLAQAISGAEAVNRAEQWVFVGMPYCQCANHAYDSHGQCNRPDNAEWDPYRSDCSGLVSWAWGLPPPGRVTWQFAPFQNDITHVINAADLAAGDALNSQGHIMLFKAWVVPGAVATLIDEHNWGTNAREKDFNVSINGSTITRSDWPSNPFTAIRYNDLQNCQAHCEGNLIVGADCGKGDCGVYGATCADDSLGLRCVNVFCPATGHAKNCIDDKQIIECQDGAPLGVGDCSVYAAFCSTALGGDALCVSAFCVSDPSEVPVVHDVCLPNGQLGHCDAQGAPAGEDCPPELPCTEDENGARCGPPPTTGENPPEGSGSGGSGWSSSPIGQNGAGTGGGAGASDDAAPDDMQGGCSVTTSRRSSEPFALLLLGLLAFASRRRRRA